MDWTTRRGRLLLGLGAVGMFGILIAMEVLGDEDPITLWDLVTEASRLGLLIGTTFTSVLLMSRVREQEERSEDLLREVQGIHARNDQWRAEMSGHVRELGTAIQKQFTAWGLSPSEQEVGLLLLKGFSHKEIARLRRTSEATIRQQAAAVYQKSGLSGRTGLSAFFLEELLLPDTSSQRRAAE